MLKRGLYITIIFVMVLIMFSALAAAQDENESLVEDVIEKAYSCLEDQIANKTTLGLPDATFSLLALGSRPKIMQKIEDEKKTDAGGTCWPKAGCKIKETAQIGLAFAKSGQSTDGIKRWFLTKNSTATELNWYLQIDIVNGEAATCTIARGKETPSKINIGEDMKITGSPGACFTIFDNYKLRASSSCLNSEFEIACNKDFATATLYQRGTGAFFVSSDTKSASGSPALDTKVTQKFNSKCFKTGAACDYEGSLWAAIFLRGDDEDISPYLPYLLAYAEDNKKYFPSAFLHILVGGDEQYDSVVKLQKINKANEGYWEMLGTPYTRYYDTSLGMLSLTSRASTELDNAKNYLLSVQGKSGCWNNNNVRDTAFVLYSGWPRETGGGGGGITTTYCEPPYSCENGQDCTSAGGNIIFEAECLNFDVCCSISVPEKTCSEKGGELCSAYQGCAGDEVSSSDGTCCIGTCATKELPTEDECTLAGGVCREICESGEMEGAEFCADEMKCCIAPAEEEKGTSAWVWILLLLILIALVVLAIIYRDKVRMWWFKLKEKFKKKPSAPGAMAAAGRMPPRQMMPQQRPGMYRMQRPMPAQPMPARVMSAKDKEMEETLKKLREIGK